MFKRALKHLREGIRQRQYVVTLHAEEEMEEDNLSITDVERAILTGEILERHRNGLTGELKYRVRGQTVAGDEVEVIVKFGATGKAVIITVYVV